MPRRKTKTKLPAPITVEKVETSRDRFFRIGQRRMENALRGIRLIGNLSAPHYEVTDAEVAKMYSVLQSTINEVFERFTKARPKKYEETFILSDEPRVEKVG